MSDISDPSELGDQLRKPSGDKGKLVAEAMNSTNQSLYQLALPMLVFADNESLLEVGFGNGKFFEEYLKKNPTISLTGLDYSSTMCEECTVLNEQLIKRQQLKIVCADTFNMPFEEASFDKIVGINVVYFWNFLDLHLEELHKVLKNKGQLLIGFRPRKIVENFLFTRQGFILYEAEELKFIFKDSGFEVVSEQSQIVNIKSADNNQIKVEDICILFEKS